MVFWQLDMTAALQLDTVCPTLTAPGAGDGAEAAARAVAVVVAIVVGTHSSQYMCHIHRNTFKDDCF